MHGCAVADLLSDSLFKSFYAFVFSLSFLFGCCSLSFSFSLFLVATVLSLCKHGHYSISHGINRGQSCVSSLQELSLVTERGGFGDSVVICRGKAIKIMSTYGNRSGRRTFEYGRTYVVRPRGRHQATIVWLHGLGDNGSSWSQLLEALPLLNIKWICPTAATRPVAAFGGFPCTACMLLQMVSNPMSTKKARSNSPSNWRWRLNIYRHLLQTSAGFDVRELSEDGPDDTEGLDAAAAHVATLLSTEPSDIKLGVGGFSMGAAAALYSATCFANGTYNNGNPYPINLSAVVGQSGWLPCSRTLKSKIEGSQEAARRAASMPILLCHGKGDDVVPYKRGQKSAEVFSSTGFRNMAFRTYNGLGHYTVPEEMDDVCRWLTAKLGLDRSR